MRIITILIILLSVNFIVTQHSPYQQIEDGLTMDGVVCKEDLELIMRSNGIPACVKPSTAKTLVERGLASYLTDDVTEVPASEESVVEADSPASVIVSEESKANYASSLQYVETLGSVNTLLIPPLIDSKEQEGPIRITIQNGQHEFFANQPSQTKGYNGDYFGPTIRMYKNAETRIQFVNQLDEDTTVHGHGLQVSGELDGGPQGKIGTGETWDITLPIVQEASTNWYHPHLMGKTAEQLHDGLAGFYLIEDEHSQSLGLPNTYGVDDIPLAIQDRTFVDGKMVPYPEEIPDDLREPTLIVNGTLNPEVRVPPSLVRLRLLNASNGRAYEFYLSDKQPFYKIATEGGLLESPVELTKIRVSSGERNDIVIDMSSQKEIDLMATFLEPKYDDINTFFAPFSRVLRIKVDDMLSPLDTSVPETLNKIDWYDVDNVVEDRFFDLEDMKINGQSMDMSVINERVRKGALELWTIDSGRHPFHIHGASFQIISHNGKQPTPEHRGWKDTVDPRGTAKVLIRFGHVATEEYPYMYHCHILEHEDLGMMGQFTVQ